MKNVKALLCLLSALILSTAAQAHWEGNWLVGIAGGYGQTSGNLDITITPVSGLEGTTFPTKLETDRWLWGLLTGYQATCNRWLLGGEVAFEWQDRDHTVNLAFTDALGVGWIAAAQFQRQGTASLTGRLGYAVSEFFMPYFRLGVETSRDRLNFIANSVAGLVVSQWEEQRSYRFIGGVGAEMPLPFMSGLSLRLEYNYHSPNKSINASSLANDNVTLVTTGIKQKNNTAKAALIWNFF